MRIAVASDNDMVTGHFGHCSNFNIYHVENDKITKSETVLNPGHKPGFLPNYLKQMGVDIIIAGGMGQGAKEIFSDNGIEVITGATGEAKVAAEEYLNGNLKSNDSTCHDHNHEHVHHHHGGCNH